MARRRVGYLCRQCESVIVELGVTRNVGNAVLNIRPEFLHVCYTVRMGGSTWGREGYEYRYMITAHGVYVRHPLHIPRNATGAQ